jgi:hypothetical protein
MRITKDEALRLAFSLDIAITALECDGKPPVTQRAVDEALIYLSARGPLARAARAPGTRVSHGGCRVKITVESTDHLVHFAIGNAQVPARIWEGFTDDGIPVHCFVTRICPSIPEPLPADIEAKFKAALLEQKPPTAALARAIPLRMIL